MFRIDPENPMNGPHQKMEPTTSGKLPGEAEAAMILVHGRGASAESILMLAEELEEPELHYVAPQAQGYTWYPYSFMVPTERNQPGLNSGLQRIHDLIAGLESNGIPKWKIILLGFSQGACLVTEFAARHPARYGGLVALSGGLIGDRVHADSYSGSLEQTPAFMGCSDIDPHIPLERVNETADVLESMEADLTKKIYTGMGHTVNEDELSHVRKMIQVVRSK